MDSVLAVLFHRSAATLYFIYSLWAISALVVGILPITENLGSTIGTLVFPLLIVLTAAPAGIGATFWPNMARLELFSGSSFCMVLLIYLYFIGARAVTGEGNWAGLLVSLSFLVIPVARTVIVTLLLLRQAEERKIQGD